MIVCHCNVVSDRDIRAAIDQGADRVCDVASACGAASRCGGCVPGVRRLLSERHATPELDATVRAIREHLGLPTGVAPATV